MGIMIKLIDIDSDKILPGSQFCRKYSEDLSDRDKQPYQRLMLLIFCCFCRQFYHDHQVSKKMIFYECLAIINVEGLKGDFLPYMRWFIYTNSNVLGTGCETYKRMKDVKPWKYQYYYQY